MIRRFAIASLLTVASAAGLSSTASAQNASNTVNFTANNAGLCVVTGGTGNVSATPSTGLAESLSGTGLASVRCNTPGTTSSAITQTSGTPLQNSHTSSVVSIPGTGNSTDVPVSFTATPPSGSTAIPSGEYTYDIVVTVAY